MTGGGKPPAAARLRVALAKEPGRLLAVSVGETFRGLPPVWRIMPEARNLTPDQTGSARMNPVFKTIRVFRKIRGDKDR